MNIVPDALVVPFALGPTARTIVESTNRSGTANNDKNVASDLRVITSPYLTDTNNWFMIDSKFAKMRRLNWFQRVNLELASSTETLLEGVLKIRARMRHAWGFSDWRWVYGHSVSA